MNIIKRFIFNNILPATFKNSKTYYEQVRELKDKLNEVIEVVNQLAELHNEEGDA